MILTLSPCGIQVQEAVCVDIAKTGFSDRSAVITINRNTRSKRSAITPCVLSLELMVLEASVVELPDLRQFMGC